MTPMTHFQRVDHGQWVSDSFHTGLLYGHGVFTTFIAAPQEPVWRLGAHFDRLVRDSAFFQLALPWVDETAFEADLIAWQAQHLSLPMVVRITVCSPQSPLEALPNPQPALVFISTRPIPKPMSAVNLVTVTFDRLFPQCKHMSQIAEAVYLAQAKAQGFSDYLRINTNGFVAEASYANAFFLEESGTLHTPDPLASGCLPGIMGQAVQRAAQQAGIPVVTGHYRMEDLKTFCGGFITNVVRGLVPITRIDEHESDLAAVSHCIKQIRMFEPYLRSYAASSASC